MEKNKIIAKKINLKNQVEREIYSKKLQNFEKEFTYPLGNESFYISHGLEKDYFVFFDCSACLVFLRWVGPSVGPEWQVENPPLCFCDQENAFPTLPAGMALMFRPCVPQFICHRLPTLGSMRTLIAQPVHILRVL